MDAYWERYYRNETDILERVRTAIGASGAKEPVGNLANNKLPNAFTRKLVDQKVGYLLGKPMSIQTKTRTIIAN
ncbi:phage portal protein [Paenibacillus thiaminolyticus]|uniref:phage portal protein n=1 Tax=Paenibacillus thiaminolyticus TaxID=49283 RepID=UPI0023F9BAE8|nr:phage portal protein [Paenibacillus thiaminolyticus]